MNASVILIFTLVTFWLICIAKPSATQQQIKQYWRDGDGSSDQHRKRL
jgi:hypothetical protein